MNSPFILNFDKFECNQFWKKDPRNVQTVCRISAYLRTVGKNKIILNCQSKSNIEHAEIIALKLIDKKLNVRLIKQFNIYTQASESQTPTELVFDFSVRLNRSPCSSCQKCILNKILEIQLLVPGVNIRFVLFFSFLDYNATSAEEKTLKELNQWILSFINNGISVIIGPIIVTQIVPKPMGICTRQSQIKENINLIFQFRKLVSRIHYSLQGQTNCDFIISIDRIFSNEDCIEAELKNYSINNPKYIPIFPNTNTKHFLSELVPKIEQIVSTSPIKRKIIAKRQYINSRVRTFRINGKKNRSRKRKSTSKKKPNKEYPETNPTLDNSI